MLLWCGRVLSLDLAVGPQYEEQDTNFASQNTALLRVSSLNL